jgi:hypothetical protein
MRSVLGSVAAVDGIHGGVLIKQCSEFLGWKDPVAVGHEIFDPRPSCTLAAASSPKRKWTTMTADGRENTGMPAVSEARGD